MLSMIKNTQVRQVIHKKIRNFLQQVKKDVLKRI